MQGPELTDATVMDAWFIPDQPDMIQDDAGAAAVGAARRLHPGAEAGSRASSGDQVLSGVLSVRDRAGLQTDVVVTCDARAGAGTGDAAAGPDPGVRVPGRADPEPDAVRVPDPGDEGGVAGQARRTGHAAMRCPIPPACWSTFVALAGVLLAARAAGTAAGWGFQFSSPVFVAAMTWLLFAVGLNLSGVFEVGSGLTGAGSGLAGRRRRGGKFLHRAAGGSGGDALHRAVHGRGGRRRAGGAPGGDRAGVRRDGAGAGRALCGPGLHAGPGRG